jgi:hypothetical protein
MELNNFLQGVHGHARMLTWEFECVGPQNDCTWRAFALSNKFPTSFSSFQTDFTVCQIVNGVEHGRGENRQKALSMEAAAYHAWVALGGH